MPWFKVDDALHSHPKARRCGLEALGLWAVAGSHCMAYLTDGHVEPWVVQSWPRGEKLAKCLVDAGLWDKHPSGGWSFHDWETYQPTKSKVEEDRRKERERKAAWRESQQDTKPPDPVCPAGTTNGTDGGSPPSPTRPDPTHSFNTGSQASNGSNAREREEPPRGPSVGIDGWKIIRDVVPSEHPQATRTALALEASAMLTAGTTDADVRAGLELWLSKPNLGPRTLPSLVSEVIRNRDRPLIAATNGRTASTTDLRVAQAQALKRPEWDDDTKAIDR